MVPNVVIVHLVKYVGKMESVELVSENNESFEYRIHLHEILFII